MTHLIWLSVRDKTLSGACAAITSISTMEEHGFRCGDAAFSGAIGKALMILKDDLAPAKPD